MVAVVASGVEGRGERAGDTGQVERDRGQDQPGAVGGEPSRGQVSEGACLEVPLAAGDSIAGAVSAVVSVPSYSASAHSSVTRSDGRQADGVSLHGLDRPGRTIANIFQRHFKRQSERR